MSLTKRPQIITPPPPPAVVQEQVETPSPVPTPSAPEAQAARRRANRQASARQGFSSTILTSPQGLTGLSPTTPIGSTLLGS